MDPDIGREILRRLDCIDGKIDGLSGRFDDLGGRFDQLWAATHHGFDALSNRIDRLDVNMNHGSRKSTASLRRSGCASTASTLA